MLVTSSIDNSIRLWGEVIPSVFKRSLTASSNNPSHLRYPSSLFFILNIK